MFGEELVQKARNECHTIIQVGDELGAPVGIALRICRKTIDSYGLPQPGDVLAWITSGKRSDADVKINLDELIDYSENFVAGGMASIVGLNRAIERVVLGN